MVWAATHGIFPSRRKSSSERSLPIYVYTPFESKADTLPQWLFINALETRPLWIFIKLAFFWSYKRIFQPKKAMRWLCYGGAFVCTSLYIAAFFHDLFQCIPVQKDYNSKIPGHCLPAGVGGSVTAIFNVISDFYILVLPLPFVWSLQMKLHRKLRLMALFGLGAL